MIYNLIDPDQPERKMTIQMQDDGRITAIKDITEHGCDCALDIQPDGTE